MLIINSELAFSNLSILLGGSQVGKATTLGVVILGSNPSPPASFLKTSLLFNKHGLIV